MYLKYRLVHAGITEAQWPEYIREAFRVLKSGTGWVQLVELGLPFTISGNDMLPKDAALNKVVLPLLITTWLCQKLICRCLIICKRIYVMRRTFSWMEANFQNYLFKMDLQTLSANQDGESVNVYRPTRNKSNVFRCVDGSDACIWSPDYPESY